MDSFWAENCPNCQQPIDLFFSDIPSCGWDKVVYFLCRDCQLCFNPIYTKGFDGQTYSYDPDDFYPEYIRTYEQKQQWLDRLYKAEKEIQRWLRREKIKRQGRKKRGRPRPRTRTKPATVVAN